MIEEDLASNACSFASVYLNSKDREPVGLKWRAHCVQHGVNSAWYNSEEQVTKRRADTEKLIDIQRRAAEARASARKRR